MGELSEGDAVGRKVASEVEPADKEALFANVKRSANSHSKENQIDVALEAYKFLSLHEDAGIEMWRMLADLFEKKAERAETAGNMTSAQKHLERSIARSTPLTHNAKDAGLLARKDRYYYSIGRTT